MSDNYLKMSVDMECQRENIRVQDLFYDCRLQNRSHLCKLLLYFPIGVLLLAVRLVTGVVTLLLLTLLPSTSSLKGVFFKGMCKFLGFVIDIDDKYLDENCKLLVANHVSILDRLAVNVLMPCKTVGSEGLINEYTFWNDADTSHDRDIFTDEHIHTFHKYMESSSFPVLSFPESAITNGKVGLLKFKQFPFMLKQTVQPVIIKTSSPFTSISPSVLGSSTLSDVLWLLFVPCIVFNLKVLPCMSKSPEESTHDFCKRTQKVMAKALGIAPTVYTSRDKAELKMRKTSTDLPRSAFSRTSATDHCLHLPKTTTSNTVETSNSQFVPKFDTAAKTFGKTPKERMQSYKERKDVLMESARIKYILSKGNL